MIVDQVELLGIEALEPGPNGGRHLVRVPEAVRRHLNEMAQERAQHPAGAELRFVLEPGQRARVTLSCIADLPAEVYPFWGPFRGEPAPALKREPVTVELAVPDRVAALRRDVAAGFAWAPTLCRVILPTWGRVFLHDVEGPVRLPRAEEKPARTLLAFGTSITQGYSAFRPYLSYAAQTARRLRMDLVNLGLAGSCWLEPEFSDWIAGRRDWDAAVFCLSVNMASRGYPVEVFRERAEHLLRRVVEQRPGVPVLCMTILPWYVEFCEGLGDTEATEAYRACLREVVEHFRQQPGGENLHVVDGPEMMPDITGHQWDLLHPTEIGMAEIAENLARVFRERFPFP